MKIVEQDKIAIDELTHRFFDLFTNISGKKPNVEDINNLFIKQGIIISNNTGEPIIYNLQEFIEPRKKMLSDGTLTDFKEHELSHKTEIFNHIAQRFCLYEKSGKLNGKPFKTKGMKSIQFIKIDNQWKMVSVVWCDKGS